MIEGARAILLALLAGWIDASGFLQLNGLFQSFMSGNTTQLGVAIARGHWSTVFRITSVVALFVFGVIGGEWAAAIGSRPLVLGGESVLLWMGAPLSLALRCRAASSRARSLARSPGCTGASRPSLLPPPRCPSLPCGPRYGAGAQEVTSADAQS
jgi:uncharacterized membrane protein YoaK (UPF0700 family)